MAIKAKLSDFWNKVKAKASNFWGKTKDKLASWQQGATEWAVNKWQGTDEKAGWKDILGFGKKESVDLPAMDSEDEKKGKNKDEEITAEQLADNDDEEKDILIVNTKDLEDKNEPEDIIQADFGKDEDKTHVRSLLPPPKDGTFVSSSNPDHYKFVEGRKIDGVEKAAAITDIFKADIVKTIAKIEDRALHASAKEKGYDVKKTDMGNGKTEYQIIDPKTDKPITPEQMRDFHKATVDNFNKFSKEECQGKPFSLTKTIHSQPQQQKTLQSEKAEKAATQQQQQTSNTASTPSSTASTTSEQSSKISGPGNN